MAGQTQPATDDKIQSEGRRRNAALPLNDAEPNGGAERYPATSKDDGVEAPAAGRPDDEAGEDQR